jgi:hypothetical protein
VPEEPPCARDPGLEAYKLWLVARYAIVRNETLSAFVCGEKLFATVDEALAHAHAQELQRVAAATARAEAVERAAREFAESSLRATQAAAAASLAQRERLRAWVAANRVVLAAICAVVVVAAALGGYRFGQHRKAEAAALAAAQNLALSAASDAKAADATLAEADRAWSAARSSAAKRLMDAEIARIEVTVSKGMYGLQYDARVRNGSRYHVQRLSGHINLFARGVEIGKSASIYCCDEAHDAHGFGMGYALAPGATGRKEMAVMSFDFKADSPEDRKFAAEHGIPLSRNLIGDLEYNLDSRTRFDGTVVFVTPGQKQDSGASIRYPTERVDFDALAEALPEVRALKGSRDAAAAVAADRRAALEAAEAALKAIRH